MKNFILLSLFTIVCSALFAQKKLKEGVYNTPDSIIATGIYTEVVVNNKSDAKKIVAYLNVDETTLAMQLKKGRKQFYFSAFKFGKVMVVSPGVVQERLTVTWDYDWKYGEKYTFLVLIAIDSAKGNSIYSGYVYLPAENMWKLLGTIYSDFSTGLSHLAAFNKNKKGYAINFSDRWLLRRNNTWKALDAQTTQPPVLRPMRNIDSLAQQRLEEDTLRANLPKEGVQYKEGIFYQMLKEGSGRKVKLTDSVVVYYKGWLFSNGAPFDSTMEKPATFPLTRLIRGWQVGVTECRVGGKVRLWIPSGSAYSIRTFATSIPPNSTLVFDVEVLDVKEKQQ